MAESLRKTLCGVRCGGGRLTGIREGGFQRGRRFFHGGGQSFQRFGAGADIIKAFPETFGIKIRRLAERGKTVPHFVQSLRQDSESILHLSNSVSHLSNAAAAFGVEGTGESIQCAGNEFRAV